jgi:hypothetical protein
VGGGGLRDPEDVVPIVNYGPLTKQENLRQLSRRRLHIVMLFYHLGPWPVNWPLCIETERKNETCVLIFAALLDHSQSLAKQSSDDGYIVFTSDGYIVLY